MKGLACPVPRFALRCRQGAVKYLTTRKEINQQKIGLIGHSDGAMIAPMALDSDVVRFIVLLVGPGIEGGACL